jgi:hypothetical protein
MGFIVFMLRYFTKLDYSDFTENVVFLERI